MVLKAARTRDLKSYSLAHILLANIGNVFHSVYVFNLPAGPIWLLHGFHVASTALMLIWYLRYEWLPGKSLAESVRRPSGSATPAQSN